MGDRPLRFDKITRDVYSRFLDSLIQALKFTRLHRIYGYDRKQLETTQEKLLDNIYQAKEELNYLRAASRVFAEDQRAEKDLEEEIQDLEERYEVVGKSLAETQDAYDKLDRDLRSSLCTLYEFDAQAVFRTSRWSPVKLSSLFWRALRQNKQGFAFLKESISRLGTAELESAISNGATRETLAVVRQRIKNVENAEFESLAALSASLTQLHWLMHPCRMWNRRLVRLRSNLQAAKARQQLAEISFLTTYAAPVLEAHGLLESDRLRASIIDEDPPGRPFLHPDPPIEADDESLKDLDDELATVDDKIKARKAALEQSDKSYTKDLYPYLIAHPRRKQSEFRAKHLAFKKQVSGALQELEDDKRKILRKGKEYGRWARFDDHDFYDHPGDKKHKAPRTAGQLETKAKKLKTRWSTGKEAAIVEWITLLQDAGDHQYFNRKPPAIPEPLGPSAHFSDLDRDTDNSLDERALELRTQLLRKYEKEQAAMMEALTADMSDSEESVRCC